MSKYVSDKKTDTFMLDHVDCPEPENEGQTETQISPTPAKGGDLLAKHQNQQNGQFEASSRKPDVSLRKQLNELVKR